MNVKLKRTALFAGADTMRTDFPSSQPYTSHGVFPYCFATGPVTHFSFGAAEEACAEMGSSAAAADIKSVLPRVTTPIVSPCIAIVERR